jgi:hypothetical protein
MESKIVFVDSKEFSNTTNLLYELERHLQYNVHHPSDLTTPEDLYAMIIKIRTGFKAMVKGTLKLEQDGK